MLEALWSVEFVSNVQGFGAGVAVMETGRILGGDSRYIYVGSFAIENEDLKVKVKVTHYFGEPYSIFGPRSEFNLTLTGKPAHDGFEMQGHMIEDPNLRIGVRLTRRAELP